MSKNKKNIIRSVRGFFKKTRPRERNKKPAFLTLARRQKEQAMSAFCFGDGVEKALRGLSSFPLCWDDDSFWGEEKQ